MKKRQVISLFLTLLMIVSIIPISAVPASAAGSDDLIWPCESAYYVTCMYYYKDGSKHSTRYGYDKGMDIAGGGNILAAEAGIVETAAYQSGGFGNYVVIKHSSGERTLYGHLSSYSVTQGQKVTRGQKIGVMGSTGNSSGTHLHFEYSGGDPWKTYYNSKYASKIVFEQNVRSNNNSYNSDKTIVNVIDSNYKKNGTYYYYSGTHIHSYSGSYYETAHPHREYQKCSSCDAIRYTGACKTVSSCAQCTMTVDAKYNTVKGFKAYPCVTSNFEVKTGDLTTRGGEIYTTDFCTINELYTNGWCKVTFPMDSGGTRTAYTKISNFIKSPSASLTKYTATGYINLYSTSSLSTKIYRIYPGDVCYTVGTSGSATQIFMPMSSGGYYVLGWVSTGDLPITPSPSTEKLSAGLTSLSSSLYAKCRTITSGRYSVYTSPSLSTRGYEGTASPTAWTGENDEIWIIGVGINSAGTAYAKIKYPVGSSRYTAYVPLHSTLVPGSLTDSYRTAIAKVTGFSDRPGGSINNSYWVDPGEKVYLLSQQNGYSQILYPTSGVWRIAWCTNSMYNSMFQAQTYVVTYNANGGTGAPSAQTKTRDVALTLSSTKPTRPGYTFVGWATSSTATTAQYSAGSVYTNEASVTLYAVWRKQTFTITYNANSGINAPGVQTQTYGTAIVVTNEKPSKTYTVNFNANGGTVNPQYYSFNCEFKGWSENSNGSGTLIKSGSSYTPNKNVTLYAVYGNPTFQSYPIPSRTGYTFNGWYTAASGGTKWTVTSTISANTTLYAQWERERYSVLYYSEGATNLPAEQTKINGTDLILSSQIPVKSGCIFKGWTLDPGKNNIDYLPGAKYTSNQAVVLYAVWEANTYTVTYNANGGSGAPSSQTKTHDVNLTLSSIKPTRTGYTFLGWSTSSTATSAVYQPGSSFTSNANTTLYAVWKANTYTITYNANGGLGAPGSQIKTHGVNLTLSSTKPTRAGYTFLGWSTSSTATGATYQPGSSFTSNADTTLYAVWKANTTALSVNSSNSAVISTGGEMKYFTFTPTTSGKYVIYSTGSDDTKVYLYNASGTELDSDDDDGDGNNFRLEYNLTAGTTYTFSIKYYNSSKTGTISFKFGNVFTVTYNANGGSGAPSAQSKDYGTNITLSSIAPTRTGYTFLGWSTVPTATGTDYDYQPGSSFTSNANTTLYAVWRVNTYTVAYNANGGLGAPGSQTKTHGVNLTLSSTKPTRAGYTFLGWSTSSTATSATYQPGSSFTSNASTTLYAVWKANTYTITYNANGGSGAPGSQIKTHGVSLTLSNTKPTRAGYTFLGWSTSSTATGAVYQPGSSFIGNANTTLYAVWKANTYTITYNANGGSGAPGSQIKTHGVSLTLSNTKPTRAGYTFLGWSTSSTATGAAYQPGGSFTSNANTTLYAVWGKIPDYQVTLSQSGAELATNSTLQLQATVLPGGYTGAYTWSSSDERIATVDRNGLVTAHRYGKVVITVTIDGGKTAECTIQTRFYDVVGSNIKGEPNYQYYYNPVYWAADNGITTGYDKVYFGPERDCERREMLIFLWRIAGCPTGYGDARNYFIDLDAFSASSASNKAIAWAYKTGITKGYSDGGFHPYSAITRGETMILLYRVAGKPAVSGKITFPDIVKMNLKTTSDTYKAILWGSQKKITSGYSDGNFRPNDNCLREAIVTFLYRYSKLK